MWDNLFGAVDLLQKGVDASWLRNEVISNNIANADTVGFKASKVNFEDLFSQSLQGTSLGLSTTNGKHFSEGASEAGDVEPEVTTDSGTSIRYDGNNVDAEHEMAELAKNTIEYYTLVGKMNSEFSKLDSAIKVT